MIYRCKDRLCGAEDCSTCYPFNEHEMREREARAEYEEMKADMAMEERQYEE